jgi:hypothetical protein
MGRRIHNRQHAGATSGRATASLLTHTSFLVRSCPSFSSLWLMFMNVIYAIFGIVLMAGSSWGIVQAQANPLTAGERAEHVGVGAR